MTQTILITGSSSGFGRETAILFQQKGWNVIATMRSPEKETELNRLSNVLVTRLDVTDKHSIENAVKEGIEKFGNIDVLLNNAGFGIMGPMETTTEESIRREFDVNVLGLINVTKTVLPVMRANKAGIIINVSSAFGVAAFPFFPIYNASKFAVEGLTESLQFELRPLGINLKIVEPGGYNTNFSTTSIDVADSGNIQEYSDRFTKFANAINSFPFSDNISEVAEKIYEAATDNLDRLRYSIGAGVIETRKNMDDEAYYQMIANHFGL
jgi:NADP-dependent 3-hydroxy acid dehydrogenase YdfG